MPRSPREILREKGLRATGPRLAVVETLAARGRPVSHSEVLERMGDIAFDPATVYRSLVKLVEVGIAQVVTRAGGMDRYALVEDTHETHAEHPHFVCTDCGRVSCLPGTLSLRTETVLREEVADRWAPSVRHATLQLQGECPDCIELPEIDFAPERDSE